MHFKLLVLFAFVALASSYPTKEYNLTQELFNGLNHSEKVELINYLLMEGYLQLNPSDAFLLLRTRHVPVPEDLEKKFENIEIPEDFPLHFTQGIMRKFNLEKRDVLRLAKGEWICINGECFDTGDVGNICCT